MNSTFYLLKQNIWSHQRKIVTAAFLFFFTAHIFSLHIIRIKFSHWPYILPNEYIFNSYNIATFGLPYTAAPDIFVQYFRFPWPVFPDYLSVSYDYGLYYFVCFRRKLCYCCFVWLRLFIMLVAEANWNPNQTSKIKLLRK